MHSVRCKSKIIRLFTRKNKSVCESNSKNDQLCYLATDGAEIYKEVIN